MANKKISELTAITSLDSADLIPVVDSSEEITNKITWENLLITQADAAQTFTNKTLTAPDINGGTADLLTSLTIANNVDIGNYELRALKFQSDQATGTAPLIVASTTKVANLNADKCDGDDLQTSSTIDGVDLAELKDISDYADSPMIITGGEISKGSDQITYPGSFKVAALTALLRKTNSVTGELVKVSLDEQDNQTITAADTTYYVCLNYNAGSPTISLSETNPYDSDKRNIPIGKVAKDSSDNVHYISGGFRFQDGVKKLHIRAKTLRALELNGGSSIAYSGTNNFTMEEGIAYGGINKFPLNSYDSAITQFTGLRGDGAGDFTETLSNVIDFAHYDDGAGGLGNIGNNRFGCHWVYKHIDDDDVYVRLGVGSYTLAEAMLAQEPSKPSHLTDFGCLIGKIIAPKNGGSFAAVQMVTERFFTGTEASDHGNLTGLEDDDHTQYALLAGRAGGQILSGSPDTGEDLTLQDNNTDNNTITVSEMIAKQDALTFGIADTNAVRIDDVDAADNDYAKFTANGLEGRGYSEVLGDLSGHAGAAFDFNGQDLTNVDDISCDTIASTGAATAGAGAIGITSIDPSIRFKKTDGIADLNTFEIRPVSYAGATHQYLQIRKINDAHDVFTDILKIDLDSLNATFYGDITLGANTIGRDADNLIDFSTDNQISLKTNGTTALTLDSSQVVDLSGTSRVAGDPTTDGYFVIKLSGVSYKVPCVAV